MELSARAILTDALTDLRYCWPRLIAADLLARIVTLLLLAPLVGLLLRVFLLTSETGVVADAAIVDFVLHPIGITAVLLGAALALTILLIEFSQLMVIGFATSENTWIRARQGLAYVVRYAPRVFALAGLVVLRLLVIALPFLAALGALYGFALREHDINYYLAEQPPEFLVAGGLAVLMLAGMALLMAFQLAGWSLALPMVLFERLGGRAALRASRTATAAHRARIFRWLVMWVGVACLASSLINVLSALLIDALIPRTITDPTPLVAMLTAVVFFNVLANLAVTIFFTIFLPLFLVRLYRTLAGPGALRPAPVRHERLDERSRWSASGRAVAAIAAAALLALLGGAYLFQSEMNPPQNAEIIAHRGGAAVAPENTIAAFERAIADGADWLELDVQEDADGEVVIVHDRDYMRIGKLSRDVADTRLSDLRDIDIGSFFDAKFADQRVPTLREVLELARGRCGLCIELKYYGRQRDLEQKVVELVEAAGMTPHVVIMSLEYPGVARAAALRPAWTRGLLSAVAIGDLTRLDVNFIAVAARAATRSTIRRAHARGLKVYAWTINDPVQMWVMLSRGADGLITDRVALAGQVLELRAKMTPFGRFVIWMAAESGLLRGNNFSSPAEDA